MRTGRILIVDDSDNIRNVLQMNFEWLGYQVISARDGEEALKRVMDDPPDLIILDVMMPRRNGYQVCRSLKMDAALRDIPVIFLTAKDQKEDRFWGKDCGADEYVTKPFSAAKLERVIERLLDERDRRMHPGGDAEARYEEWKGAEIPCAIATYRLDGKALGVFRQKYGEIKYGEALEGVRQTIEIVLKDDVSDFVVERGGEGVFRVVLPCDRAKAEALSHRICAQCDLYLRSFYAKDDAERGYIVSRANPAGPEIHVPLMALERTLAADGVSAA